MVVLKPRSGMEKRGLRSAGIQVNAHFSLAHTSSVLPACTDLGNISAHSKVSARLGSIFLSERIEGGKKKSAKEQVKLLFRGL